MRGDISKYKIGSWTKLGVPILAVGLWVTVSCVPMDGMNGNGNGNANGNNNGNANGNTNGNTNANGNGNANDNQNDNGGKTLRVFAGAERCRDCHPGDHANWVTTPHAEAIDSLVKIGQDKNAACLPCHVVGFGEEGGYVDMASTPDLAGVQCENCHGAGAAHADDPGNAALRPTINLTSETSCGQCHTDVHHPTIDEWRMSKHAVALETLQNRDFAPDTCLECHSEDYRRAIRNGEEPPTVATATNTIECSTCHAPHGNTGEPSQLRDQVASLCGDCHTQGEDLLPGNTPHHPQLQMLVGTGAFDEAGESFEASSPHSILAMEDGAACAQCHVIMFEAEDPMEGNPNVTGHTFNPFDKENAGLEDVRYTGCMACHTAEAAAALRFALQSELEGRLKKLAPFFDAESDSFIDAETLSEDNQARLSTALFNFQFVSADGSRGVHNPTYSREALDVVDTIIADLTGM